MLHCAYCGTSFDTYHDFTEHKTHGHKERIRPANTSGRPKHVIVQEAEHGWLKPYLIQTGDNIAHLEACRCNSCFQQKLDALVDRTDKQLEEMNKWNQQDPSAD